MINIVVVVMVMLVVAVVVLLMAFSSTEVIKSSYLPLYRAPERLNHRVSFLHHGSVTAVSKQY